ncbi:MAG: acylphosphatase [Planctomycetes bacterium]|nr:acylphosphatase [Planctomycetota bacterium]
MSERAANESASICRRAIFAGRVQGVGFRYTTAQIARRHAVTGFVRNLSDGTVELIAAGTHLSVAAFLADIHKRFEPNIDPAGSTTEEIDPPQKLDRFEIRSG